MLTFFGVRTNWQGLTRLVRDCLRVRVDKVDKGGQSKLPAAPSVCLQVLGRAAACVAPGAPPAGGLGRTVPLP